MATPLEGCEVDNFHGGSIIITSNSAPPVNYLCFLINTSNLKLVTSALIGTASSPTYDFLTKLSNAYE